MTKRGAVAVVLGFLGAAAVCGFCYFNDFVMRQTFLVGNYMPISVYGGLLLFLLVVNPLLFWISKRLALSGKQLAVIVCLTLAACYVPGRGLMHYFMTFLMLPHHYNRTNPGWREHKIVEMAPQQMLAGVPPRYRPEDIRDPFAFYSKLLEEGREAKATPARCIWRLLPEDVRRVAAEALAAAREDQARHAKVTAALNRVLASRGFYHNEDFEGIDLSIRGKELSAKRDAAIPAWPEDVILDALADHVIARTPRDQAARLPAWVTDRIEARRGLTDEEVVQLHRIALECAFPRSIAAHKRGVMRLNAREIIDWPAFCARLKDLAARRRANPGKRLWRLLPAEARVAVDEILGSARQVEARNTQVARALNQILRHGPLSRERAFGGLALPKEGEALRKRQPQSLSPEERQRLNRHLIDAAFPEGLRSLGAARDYVINGFRQGLGIGDEGVSLGQIPWYAWRRAFLFWLPLLVSLLLGLIGLAVVVHRQWSDHEHLPYPIVTFAHALLPVEGRSRGAVFANRLFWTGLLVVLVIHLNNYAVEWWPRDLIRIPRAFDFRSLEAVLPRFRSSWALLNPTVYFTAVGFAYFLATDVSLALGIGPFVYELVAGAFLAYGISFHGGGFLSLQIFTFLYGGAYVGMFLVVLYTGRHYYMNALRGSLFLATRDPVERRVAWGARAFLVGAGLFAALLALVGLPWYLAGIYTAGTVLIFVVISRVVAETGVFFIHAFNFPCVLLWGFLGARVLGPRSMLLMFMVTSLLLIDPREAVMPYMVQGLKLVDLNKAKVGRTAVAGAFALLLGFAVAIPVTLYWQYSQGAEVLGDGWTRGVPRMAFDATVRAMERLQAQGVLEQAGDLAGMAWVRNLAPNTSCVVAFFVALALVLLFAAGRLRFPRWPVHPVMFLALGGFQSRTLAVSFLIGWLIKLVVMKYGGAAVYHKLKPLMIGVIAGDMLGGVVPMIIGAIYWWATGEPPRRFVVLPL